MNSVYLSLISFALIIASSFGGGPSMPSCKLACTKEYFPLCASDGENLNTFSNECELEKFNCLNDKAFVVFEEGECKRSECMKACSKQFLYVCAVKDDGQYTFNSHCIFDIMNCKEKGAYKLLHEGRCSDPNATMFNKPNFIRFFE
ncbi:unnamed protein product [Chironomus riparius]|uniref:Kazal-like domain-containing protein n=1 Tax=Chironomus riparius TaxID=315576 RepID=A0A9N9RSY3_9DIPT|nr:unnamed protein product [Chironomus riparius]